jgi:hypothetical protein
MNQSSIIEQLLAEAEHIRLEVTCMNGKTSDHVI